MNAEKKRVVVVGGGGGGDDVKLEETKGKSQNSL